MMKPMIRLKTISPLLITLALLCFGLLPRAQGAQIGDSVVTFVSVENRVELDVSNDPQEVAHILLDFGVWLISPQINFLSLSTPAGTMFTAGNISTGAAFVRPAGNRIGSGGTSGSSWQHNQKRSFGSSQSRGR